MSKNIQKLVDKSDITDNLYRYCRCVDRLDPELGYSIWSSNSVADYGEFYQGNGPGVIDLICSQHKQLLTHSHQMSNILLEVQGDTAASESYVTATLRMNKNKQIMQMTVWSRYIDSWINEHGRWLLSKRIAIRDLDEIRPVTPITQKYGGARDSSDPSYAEVWPKATV